MAAWQALNPVSAAVSSHLTNFGTGSEYTWKAVQHPRLSGSRHRVATLCFILKSFGGNKTPHLSVL